MLIYVYIHSDRAHAGVNHVWSLCPCCLDCLEDVHSSFNFDSLSFHHTSDEDTSARHNTITIGKTDNHAQHTRTVLSSSGTVYNCVHALAHTRTGLFVFFCDSTTVKAGLHQELHPLMQLLPDRSCLRMVDSFGEETSIITYITFLLICWQNRPLWSCLNSVPSH